MLLAFSVTYNVQCFFLPKTIVQSKPEEGKGHKASDSGNLLLLDNTDHVRIVESKMKIHTMLQWLLLLLRVLSPLAAGSGLKGNISHFPSRILQEDLYSCVQNSSTYETSLIVTHLGNLEEVTDTDFATIETAIFIAFNQMAAVTCGK